MPICIQPGALPDPGSRCRDPNADDPPKPYKTKKDHRSSYQHKWLKGSSPVFHVVLGHKASYDTHSALEIINTAYELHLRWKLPWIMLWLSLETLQPRLNFSARGGVYQVNEGSQNVWNADRNPKWIEVRLCSPAKALQPDFSSINKMVVVLAAADCMLSITQDVNFSELAPEGKQARSEGSLGGCLAFVTLVENNSATASCLNQYSC